MTSHAGHDHPPTSAARAACRKAGLPVIDFPPAPADPRYKTADGAPIFDGAELFNYYDMVRVTVKIAGEWADPTSEFHEHWDGWFKTSGALLDGSRMCSLDHARRMGWLKGEV